jgi:hypothetical protein
LSNFQHHDGLFKGVNLPTVARRLQSIAALFAASVLTATLAGCGGGGSNNSSTSAPLDATIKGSFVLSANGTDPNDGLYDVAGVLTFDGNGQITSGVADYNLGSGIDMNVPLTGTYTVAGSTALISLTDGQGTQDTFTVAYSATGASVVSAFDGVGTGTLTPQSAGSTFTTNGTYTYSLAGQGQNALSSTGGFTVASGTITSGNQTNTDGVVVSNYPSITGILEPVQSTGRGQAAIGGYYFSYYPVTASQIILIGIDDRALLYGTAKKM